MIYIHTHWNHIYICNYSIIGQSHEISAISLSKALDSGTRCTAWSRQAVLFS